MRTEVSLAEDLAAISRVKHLYGAVIDGILGGEHTADDLDQVFSPDAVAQFLPAPPLDGLVAIKTYFGVTIPAAGRGMWHSFSNPIIDTDGDQASGRWTVLAYTQGPGDAAPTMALGRYTERYVRTAAGWRIKSLTFRRQALTRA